jgi:TAG lipase/lysophosphatidylethanolamine acyltransferase
MAAAICTLDDAGLTQLFSPAGLHHQLDMSPFHKKGGFIGSLFRKAYRFIRYGCLLDVRVVEESARRSIGDITFKEAYLRSGRILNIIVPGESTNSLLLNYLTAPDVVVWSAACAACAVPGIYESVRLMSKCQRSGELRPWPMTGSSTSSEPPCPGTSKKSSTEEALPIGRLAELFNVNSVIVSQVPSYFSIQLSPSEEATGWTTLLVKLIGEELAHRWRQLKALGLLPATLTYFERFFQAPLAGDVTISPSIYFSDILHIINSPTPTFLRACVERGERAVWKRVCQLRVRTGLEYRLEGLLAGLMACQRERQQEGWKLQRASVDSVFGERQPASSLSPSLKYRTRSFEL